MSALRIRRKCICCDKISETIDEQNFIVQKQPQDLPVPNFLQLRQTTDIDC